MNLRPLGYEDRETPFNPGQDPAQTLGTRRHKARVRTAQAAHPVGRLGSLSLASHVSFLLPYP
jgi:hypothetical protein